MLKLLRYILDTGCRTQNVLFPDLPEHALGLPAVDPEKTCHGTECGACVAICPTSAIEIEEAPKEKNKVSIDLGSCIGCGLCIENCPENVIYKNLSTRTAQINRSDLFIPNKTAVEPDPVSKTSIFKKSFAVRVVSTGCSACDLEVGASFNAIFDASRFGISFVASPRMADALIVTGPCPQGMHEALKRSYEAMPEPKIVIACGTCAVSGGVHKHGYANARGLEPILPVDVYIPGCPPHPWSIIYGMQKAMTLR